MSLLQMSLLQVLMRKPSAVRTDIEEVGELQAAGRLVQGLVVAAAHLHPGDLEVAAHLADSRRPLEGLGGVQRGCNARKACIEALAVRSDWQRGRPRDR